MVLKSVGIWSAARVSGVLYGFLGLIFGAIFTVISLLGIASTAAADPESGATASFRLLLGVGAVVFLPLFYGLMGLIMGAISAGLYNVASKLMGGVELELE